MSGSRDTFAALVEACDQLVKPAVLEQINHQLLYNKLVSGSALSQSQAREWDRQTMYGPTRREYEQIIGEQLHADIKALLAACPVKAWIEPVGYEADDAVLCVGGFEASLARYGDNGWEPA